MSEIKILIEDSGTEVNFSKLEQAFNSCCKGKLPHLRKSDESSTGKVFSGNKGYGLEFSNLRPYEFGDNIKYINWRLTARCNKPYQKVFDIISEREVLIFVEIAKHMEFATNGVFKNVQAALIAAQLAGISYYQNDAVAINCFGEIKDNINYLKATRDRQAIYQGLRQLGTKAEANLGGDLKNNLIAINKILRQGSLIFIICDVWSLDATIMTLLKKIKLNSDIVLLPIFDKIDTELPEVSNLRFKDQSNTQISLDINSNLREEYNKKWHMQLKLIADIAIKVGCYWQIIDTADTISKVTFKLIKLLQKDLV